MLRSLAKTGIACALHRTGTERWAGRRSGAAGLPAVIAYHRVVESFSESAKRSMPSMLISVGTLERHLDWIGSRYRFASLAEIRERLSGGANGGGKLAAVTFDDGYRDVYYHALPMLRRKGIPAAMFVATDLIGTSRLHHHDRLFLLLARSLRRWPSPIPELKRRLFALDIPWPVSIDPLNGHAEPTLLTQRLLRSLPQAEIVRLADALEVEVELDVESLEEFLPLTWEMVSEMHRSGMTIGSHTKTHTWLTREEPRNALGEIRGSRRELERRLGAPIADFAYPDGQFDPDVVRAVALSGYRSAFTTCLYREREHPMLTIPRKSLWENTCRDALGRFSPAMLSCYLHWAFDRDSGCEHDHQCR